MFTDRADALEALEELLGRTPPLFAESALDQSAGTKDGQTVYRPWIVAALTYAGSFQDRIVKADDVTWDTPQAAIDALLAQQRAFDVGVDVPDGWTVDDVLPKGPQPVSSVGVTTTPVY